MGVAHGAYLVDVVSMLLIYLLKTLPEGQA